MFHLRCLTHNLVRISLIGEIIIMRGKAKNNDQVQDLSHKNMKLSVKPIFATVIAADITPDIKMAIKNI